MDSGATCNILPSSVIPSMGQLQPTEVQQIYHQAKHIL